MAHTQDKYYVPHGTRWPVFASMGLATAFIGVAQWLNGSSAMPVIAARYCDRRVVVFRWFAEVVNESESGTYGAQVDRSFRHGHDLVHPFRSDVFCLLFRRAALRAPAGTAVAGRGRLGAGDPQCAVARTSRTPGPPMVRQAIGGEYESMGAWGIPALNTAILLTSGVTLTIAHHALKDNRRGILAMFLAITVLLGIAFMGFQVYEYSHAYSELNLKLSSGIYGSTFFMLTGFHGLHVTIGAIMLSVMLVRVLRGHFTPTRHFAFEATAWYWHFVDVVWLGLFIFVYWL